MLDGGWERDRDDNNGRLDEEAEGEVPVEEVELPFRRAVQWAVEGVLFGQGEPVQAREVVVERGHAEADGADAQIDWWVGRAVVFDHPVDYEGDGAGGEQEHEGGYEEGDFVV